MITDNLIQVWRKPEGDEEEEDESSEEEKE